MKPVELQIGYVLEVNDADTGASFVMVLPNSYGEITISGPKEWFPVSCFNDNLEYADCSVMKVYGLASNCYAHALSPNGRELLWERPVTKKLTMKQIEELLGYHVELVEEDNDGELQ